MLKQHNITHVVTLCDVPACFPDELTYYSLRNIEDDPNEHILQFFPEAVTFIHNAISSGKTVLVHCAAGISRSSSFACAYLMKTDRITFEEALEEIQKARPIVSPNLGFRKQLRMWYDMEYELEGNTKAHALYKMEIAAKRVTATGRVDSSLLQYAGDPGESYYMCNQCERGLFSPDHFVPHEKGVGRWGFKEYSAEELDCTGHYVQVMSWMKEQIEAASLGDLYCPTPDCKNVIGSFSWQSTICSCASVVRPAFLIHKEKVTFTGTW